MTGTGGADTGFLRALPRVLRDLASMLSGTSKKKYRTQLYSFENMLQLQKVNSIKDMCLKLGLAELSNEATNLMTKFDQTQEDEEVNQPIYFTGAIWVVAKSRKVSIEKTKILELATTGNWPTFEAVVTMMKKLHDTNSLLNSTKKPKRKHVYQEIIDNINEKNAQEEYQMSEDDGSDDEEYEVWHERMINMAREEIKLASKKAKYEAGKK
ncbi:uncharacterized protein LOC132197044 isoform X1 [Neocloeon triangulifer]|uniref:uncharacterized protein LOC132197044 isoform X1 n=3 Tax=Neocloeon triangulifer TaxID=2078957 RepID=UPI00286F3266|nr:uncharacterized protein LOC132197044 isoform X1 [Neocloeon triangulifer]